MKINRKSIAFGVCGVLGALATPSAFAQQNDNFFARDRYTAVTDRAQPEFDPVPLRLGVFNFSPALALGVRNDSNVLASGVNEVDDIIFTIAPEFRLESDWGRNFLGVTFNAVQNEYQDTSDDSGANIDTEIRGRLDVTREFTIDGAVRSGSFLEQRVAFAALEGAAEPVHYDRTGAQAGVQYQRSRVLLRGDVIYTDTNYDSVRALQGGVLGQDFRDTVDLVWQGQASYAVSPGVATFVRATLTDRDSSGLGGFDRDTQATNIQVGSNFELAALLRGDIAVGFLSEDRADPRLSDFDGLSANARLQWFPTQLTTVTFRGERTSFDPGFFNTSSAFNTNLSARVDHEFLRNVLAFGSLALTDVDYQTERDFLGNLFNRQDTRWESTLGVGYRLNRRARFEAGFTYLDQQADGAAATETYNRTVFSIGVRLNP